MSMRTRIALLVAAAVLTYWNGLSAPFLLDDQTSIVTNRSIETLSLPGPLVTPSDTPVARRPIVNLTFAVNYALGERHVRGYHVGNLVIHVLAALALFGVVRRTLLLPSFAGAFGRAATSLAWVCALVWLVHPLNSEIVEYVTQRSEGLLGLFYLLTIYCAIRAAPACSERRWEVAAAICCAAGMMCKESMVTAPLMVVLYDRVFIFNSWTTLATRRIRLYSGLAASWLLLVLMVQSSERTSAGFAAGMSSWQYLLTQAAVIPRYLYLTVWPRALVVDYGIARPVPLSSVEVQGTLLLAAAILVIVGLWRWPRIAFPAAWFFVTLAPTSSIVPIATEVGAERRMYLPLAGLVVLAMAMTYGLVARRRANRLAVGVACAALVGLLAIGTVLRNREYADPVRLAEQTVERWPSGRGYVHLGTLYGEAGDHAGEIQAFRRGAAVYPAGHYALGVALVENREIDEGLEHLRTFLALLPNHSAVTGARDLIGRVLIDRGDLYGASREFEWLLADNPADIRAMAFLAEVRLRQGRITDAIALYERAHQLDKAVGRDAAVMARYGSALATVNRLVEAERVFEEGATANPTEPSLQKLWGRSLAAGGRFAAAAERFHRALSLAPDDPEAQELVAAIERRLGAVSR